MDLALKEKFLILWKRFFKNAELPITFYYTNGDGGVERANPTKGRSCIICELARIRNGESFFFDDETVRCGGGKRYLGFTNKLRPGFEYFLSCGNEEIKGERYKRSPAIVQDIINDHKPLPITGKNIVFKRWDKLTASDNPDVVIFFARPDVLSGLFTLANFDQSDPNRAFTPFGAGCGSIVYYPYMESKSEKSRAVIGMFDPSARPCVPEDVLSFAVPISKFRAMIGCMEESFLITNTWKKILKRIE
jgi:uncharacterized protein (DUF169 family)